MRTLIVVVIVIGCFMVQGCATTGKITMKAYPLSPNESVIDLSIDWPMNNLGDSK